MTATKLQWKIEYQIDDRWVTCNRRSSMVAARTRAKQVWREMKGAYPVSVIGEGEAEFSRWVVSEE